MSKKKYKSPSTGEDCTGAQYVTELLLTRQASLNKEILTYKFWNKEPWKTRFRLLSFKVNGVLRLYGEDVVIHVLNSHEGKKIFTLKYDWVSAMFDKELERRKFIAEQNKPIVVEDNTESKPMKQFGNKSKITKLRELE